MDRACRFGSVLIFLNLALAAAMPVLAQEKNPVPTATAVLSPAGLPIVKLSLRGIPITAEVANEGAARTTGLRLRKSLGKNEGMLFVFAVPQPLSFWMKDTTLPLSIAFLDEKGTILSLDEMEPLSETPHSPKGLAQFALEMNKGWFTANGAKPGDRIDGVLDAPPDREADEKPPYALDAFQLAWGKAQLQQMLKDRPAMAPYVKEGDDLWDWTVRQFAGQYLKEGVEWDPGNPGGDFDSTAVGPNPSKGRKAFIQISPNYAIKTFHTGKPKTGPVLWWEAALEFCNLQNRYLFDSIDADARAGRIGRTDDAFEYMAVEDIVTNRNAYRFFYNVWVPNCRKLSLKPMDEDFAGRFGSTVGAGWDREDFARAFKNILKPEPDPGSTDYQKFIVKDFLNHYHWYLSLYDKYAPDVFTKKGLPIPPAGPSEEVEKKFLDQIAPVVPTHTVSAEDRKAMDELPPPP